VIVDSLGQRMQLSLDQFRKLAAENLQPVPDARKPLDAGAGLAGPLVLM
jgi:hypothetical protein